MFTQKLVYAVSVAACIVLVPYLMRREGWLNREGPILLSFRWRLLLISAIVLTLCFCAGASQIDDSYIYDRYIANALSGLGMVYNAGEHINALSSPFFEYLLLFASWLMRGNVLLASAVMSGLFMLLSCFLAEWLIPFAGLFVASTAYFYLLTGMETTLFAFMLLAVVALYVKDHRDWLPTVSVLLILTRFEGVLLVAVVALQLLRRRNFPPLRSFISALLLIVAYVFLNKHYYGVYLPSSATAKLGQGFSGFWGKWPTAFARPAIGWLHMLFGKVIYATPILIGLVVVGVQKKSMARFTAIVLPFCSVLLLLYVGMNMPGDYFWYLSPFVLFGLVYVASTIPPTRLGQIVAGLFILVSVLGSGIVLKAYRPKAYYDDYVEAGHWFKQQTPKDARIAAAEIGILGWQSERYIYDILGLTSPRNAAYIARHDSTSWLGEDRPDYIFVHANSWVWEKVAQQSSEYVPEAIHLSNGDVILRRRDYIAVARGTAIQKGLKK